MTSGEHTAEGETSGQPDLATDILRLGGVPIPQHGDKLIAIRLGYTEPVLDRLAALHEQNIDRREHPVVAQIQTPVLKEDDQKMVDAFSDGLMFGLLFGGPRRGLNLEVRMVYYVGDRLVDFRAHDPTSEFSRPETRAQPPNMRLRIDRHLLPPAEGASDPALWEYSIMLDYPDTRPGVTETPSSPNHPA